MLDPIDKVRRVLDRDRLCAVLKTCAFKLSGLGALGSGSPAAATAAATAAPAAAAAATAVRCPPYVTIRDGDGAYVAATALSTIHPLSRALTLSPSCNPHPPALSSPPLSLVLIGLMAITSACPASPHAHRHTAIEAAGISYPLIAKPLIANGSRESHQIALVFHRDGLAAIPVPYTVQQ